MPDVTAMERTVLRTLCQGAEGGEVWKDGMQLLQGYRFRDVTHQMVFEALQQIGTGRPEVIREQLPRRLALAGFPDLNLRELFEPHGLDYPRALALIRQLAEGAAGGPV